MICCLRVSSWCFGFIVILVCGVWLAFCCGGLILWLSFMVVFVLWFV